MVVMHTAQAREMLLRLHRQARGARPAEAERTKGRAEGKSGVARLAKERAAAAAADVEENRTMGTVACSSPVAPYYDRNLPPGSSSPQQSYSLL